MFAICAGLATGAEAQTAYFGGYNGNPDHLTVMVPVTASVGGVCGFAPALAPSGTFDAGDIRNAFSHNFGFTLECTVPLRMAVTSQNGGLQTASTTTTGYTNIETYSVTLDIKGANSSEVSGTCNTSQLLVTLGSSTCTFFGTASTSNGLLLNNPSFDIGGSFVGVSNGAGYSGSNILIAANYSDTLTVTLSPAQ